MASNGMQETGLAVKAYSLLCQAIGTFEEVLVMALQGYLKTNPSPKERQCINELIKDTQKQEEQANKIDPDIKRTSESRSGGLRGKQVPFMTALPSYAAAEEVHKMMDRANVPSCSMRFDISGLDMEELPKELRQQVETYGFDADGVVPLIVVPSGWEKEAQEIIDAYRIEHLPAGEQSLYDIAKYANYDLRSITGLTEEQTIAMKHYLKEAGVKYAVDGPSDGKYKLSFAAFDTKRVKQTMEIADHSMHHGRYTELFKQNVAWTEKKMSDYLYEIKNGENRNGLPLERGSAYVDRNGASIEIQKNRILYTSPSGIEKVYRRTKDAERMDNIVNDLIFNKMDHPVSLTANEYVRFKELRAMEKPLNDYLVDIERKQGHPSFSKEDIAIIAKASLERERTYAKLSQSTHGTDIDIQNPYSREQSFWSFKDEETRNFEEAFDMFEKEQSDGVYQGEDVRYQEGLPDEQDESYISDFEIEDYEIGPEYMEAEYGLNPEQYEQRSKESLGLDEDAVDMAMERSE